MKKQILSQVMNDTAERIILWITLDEFNDIFLGESVLDPLFFNEYHYVNDDRVLIGMCSGCFFVLLDETFESGYDGKLLRQKNLYFSYSLFLKFSHVSLSDEEFQCLYSLALAHVSTYHESAFRSYIQSSSSSS